MYCNTINWQINHKNNINQWTYMTSTISTIISCRVSANSFAVCHYSSIHEGICQSKRAHTHTHIRNESQRQQQKNTKQSHWNSITKHVRAFDEFFFSRHITWNRKLDCAYCAMIVCALCVIFFSFNVIIFIYVAVFLYKVSLTQRERERDRSKCEFVFVLAFN